MDLAKNPYAVLLAKLSGVQPAPVRARQGWQQLMHERYPDIIAPAVAAAWDERVKKGLGTKDRNNAVFRAEVARAVFNNLPQEEQKQFHDSAQKDKQAAVDVYKLALQENEAGNHKPEKRQE